MGAEKNWAGNYTYHAVNWHKPASVEEIQKLVKQLDKIRVVGSRHSFNGIADSDKNIVSLEKLNKVKSLDLEKKTVRVEGGIRYGDLSRFLQINGLALPNMASLPHISVAGACATATHGSGDQNRCLSDAIAAMKVVTADGEVASFSREEDEELLKGAVVGLGGIGIVTELTLDLVPDYQVSQFVFENLPFSQFEQHLEVIFSSAYSVSLFTNWEKDSFHQVWLKQIHSENAGKELNSNFFGATPAVSACHPIQGIDSIHCTEQLGAPGPWLDRLPHFRLDFTPSSGDELQSEYIIPRIYATQAIRAISNLGKTISPLLHVSEIRSIAGDDLWMSPFYKQDSIGIHFTWKDDWEAVQKVLPNIEESLAPYRARPHWGKLFTMTPEKVQTLYENITDFQKLLKKYDPKGKFRNDFMDQYIFGESQE